MLYGGCERKQARDAPAGPAPTMRRGVSIVLREISPLTFVGSLIVAAGSKLVLQKYSVLELMWSPAGLPEASSLTVVTSVLVNATQILRSS